MKLNLLTLILAITFVFTGCKDKDEIDPNLEALLGTWVFSIDTSASCTNPENDGNYGCDPERDCAVLTFNSDGTILAVYGGGNSTETFTFTVTANTMKICGVDDRPISECGEASYTIIGDNLSITGIEPDSETGCINTTVLTKE